MLQTLSRLLADPVTVLGLYTTRATETNREWEE